MNPPCIRCPFETRFALPGPFRTRYWLTRASLTSLSSRLNVDCLYVDYLSLPSGNALSYIYFTIVCLLSDRHYTLSPILFLISQLSFALLSLWSGRESRSRLINNGVPATNTYIRLPLTYALGLLKRGPSALYPLLKTAAYK